MSAKKHVARKKSGKIAIHHRLFSPNFACMLAVMVCAAAVVIFTDLSSGSQLFSKNPYNSYALQAEGWLNGRLDLGRDYGNLEIAYHDDSPSTSTDPANQLIGTWRREFMQNNNQGLKVVTVTFFTDGTCSQEINKREGWTDGADIGRTFSSNQWQYSGGQLRVGNDSFTISFDGIKMTVTNAGGSSETWTRTKCCISFPPFPSVILLPVVAVTGAGNAHGNLIALILFVIAAVYVFKLCLSFNLSGPVSAFISLFACAGGNLLYLAVRGGWVWFFAQVLAFLLTVMSFYYAKCRARTVIPYFLSPFFLACAVGCRPFQLVFAPIVAYLLYERFNEHNKRPFMEYVKNMAIWVIPAAGVCLFYLILNAARFGSPFDFGRSGLPEYRFNPQFSLGYLKENLSGLLRLPKIVNGRLTFERFNGTAFWLISPIFVAAAVLPFMAALRKETILNLRNIALVLVPVALIALNLLFTCLHRTMGGWHFGNRYTVDAIPVAVLIVAGLWPQTGDRETRCAAYFMPLAILGLLINVTGTVWLYTA